VSVVKICDYCGKPADGALVIAFRRTGSYAISTSRTAGDACRKCYEAKVKENAP